MTAKTIVLQDNRTSTDIRSLSASLTDAGDLCIEGQDLGPAVEKFWGKGNTEYEWTITIRSAHLPKLLAILGARPGDDPLATLAARCKENLRYATKTFLDKNDIPLEFWSRIGD